MMSSFLRHDQTRGSLAIWRASIKSNESMRDHSASSRATGLDEGEGHAKRTENSEARTTKSLQ
eukprot:scaffold18353_cov54-Cylindrotheca_fusiformis.AAC.2